MEPLDYIGLSLGCFGVYALGFVAYRAIHHVRRSLRIARAMNT